MPLPKRYLTAEGVGQLLIRANGKMDTNDKIASTFSMTLRAYQSLVSKGENQSSISPKVRGTLLSVFSFSNDDYQKWTSDHKQCEADNSGIIVGDGFITDINVLRKMTRNMRIQLYERWRSALGGYYAPEGLALSERDQNIFQTSLPIDLAPLRKLLHMIGVEKWELALPMKADEFSRKYTGEHLKQFRTKVFEYINEYLARATESSRSRIMEQLALVTEYLCEENPLCVGEKADFAFVPGYRSHLRAERAGELFSKGLVRKIYLSGHSPFYAKNENKPLPLTEALAMAVYLHDVRTDFGIDWNDLVIETGAHCTHQNVNFSEHAFAKAAHEQRAPLTVLIVTSPYHLRRTWLMLQRLHLRRPNIFGMMKCVAAETHAGLGKHEWHTNQDGVTAYMTEYWKIHGGRVVGEF